MESILNRYLDKVLTHAGLTDRDAADVREELESHLQSLIDAKGLSGKTEEEVLAMVEKEFGRAEDVGAGIARVKTSGRTRLLKRSRRIAIQAVAAVLIALLLKWQVVEAYAIPTNAMEPVVPSGSRVMVNKLASTHPGDLIVLEHQNRMYVAEVRSNADADGMIQIRRLNEPQDSNFPGAIPKNSVIGRVWLITR